MRTITTTSRRMGSLALCLMVAVVLVTGCGRGDAPAVEKQGPSRDKAPVVRIVVLSQEDCCDCTRKRQDGTWENLQAALSGLDPKPAVEEISFDIEADAAEHYLAMEAVMVPPGLYLLDEEGGLVKLLQGEVSKDQILSALK